MAYPTELRSRVLRLYDDGVKTAAIAKQLLVSPAWARRVKQHRDADPALRRPVGGRRPKLDRAGRDRLATWVTERPDATLEEPRARVGEELEVAISIGCLFNTPRAMKLTFKKSRSSPPNGSGRTSRRPAAMSSPDS